MKSGKTQIKTKSWYWPLNAAREIPNEWKKNEEKKNRSTVNQFDLSLLVLKYRTFYKTDKTENSTKPKHKHK